MILMLPILLGLTLQDGPTDKELKDMLAPIGQKRWADWGPAQHENEDPSLPGKCPACGKGFRSVRLNEFLHREGGHRMTAVVCVSDRVYWLTNWTKGQGGEATYRTGPFFLPLADKKKDELPGWIKDLASDDKAVRRRAEEKILKMGSRAWSMLKKAGEKTIRKKIEDSLDKDLRAQFDRLLREPHDAGVKIIHLSRGSKEFVLRRIGEIRKAQTRCRRLRAALADIPE